MKDKEAKRVVIINDIYSDTIEQAIFVLRSGGNILPARSAGTSFLQEAQGIINAYAQTIEKTGPMSGRKERKMQSKGKDYRFRRIFYIIATLLCSVVASGILWRVFEGVFKSI